MSDFLIFCAGPTDRVHREKSITTIIDGVPQRRGGRCTVDDATGTVRLSCGLCRLSVLVSAANMGKTADLVQANPNLLTYRIDPRGRPRLPALSLRLIERLTHRFNKAPDA